MARVSSFLVFITFCIALGARSAACEQAPQRKLGSTKDRPTVVFLRRLANGGSSGVNIDCPLNEKAKGENACRILTTKPDGKVSNERISLQKVEEAIQKFFKQIDHLPELRNVASEETFTPPNAIFTFHVSNGKRTLSGGFSIEDINGLRLDRKQLLQMVHYTENELSRMSRLPTE